MGQNRKIKLCKYITSEWAVTCAARLRNWMPALLKLWTNQFLTRNRKLRDPKAWNEAAEAKWVKYLGDKLASYKHKGKPQPRKRYVHGKYPHYPGQVISTKRGTWTAG